MTRAVSLAVLISLAAGAARADDASEARLQYELASELYKQKRFTEAVDRFIASNRLVPNPNVVYNIATIYVLLAERSARRDRAKSGEWYVEAYNWAQTFLAMAKADADRKDGAALQRKLLGKVAVVAVKSEPAGAEIYLDRESLGSVGRTPRELAATPGNHTVILDAPGYRPTRLPVVARRSAVVPLAATLERITGTLKVTSRPPGVKLRYTPGNVDLVAPATAKLPIGEGRATASLDGFLTQTYDVYLRDGETTVLDLELQRAADRAANLSVTGNPKGALVRLAGREIGQIPLTLSGLSPGPQSLEIVHPPPYEPWKGELLLEPGVATRVEAELIRADQRAWRGWKWLGYGAGAALLGAGGLVAMSARTAHDDFDRAPSAEGKSRVDRLNRRADLLLAGGVFTVATTALVQLFIGPPARSRAAVTRSR
jgi:outer membrane receptor for ferrienterochelin and colicins